MRTPSWLGGGRGPVSADDDDESPLPPGPAADAALLVATCEPGRWDGGVIDGAAAWRELPGSELVAARGDYHRWMQDARGWAHKSLGEVKAAEDPYRDQAFVDADLQRTARAVLSALVQDSLPGVVSALSDYVTQVRARQRPKTA